MAQIKLRIEMNKGRTGAPLEKLGDVARQFDRFLHILAADLRLDVKKGEWLAVNFKNGSVSYDAAYQGDVSESVARNFNRALEFVVDYDPETEGTNALVSNAALLEYGRIGQCIDPDEIVGLGVYPVSGGRPKMRQISYRRAAQIRQSIEAPIISYGSVQGIVHSLVKEAAEPYFQLRELASDNLVRCQYSSDHYGQIVDLLKDRRAVVHATGHIKLDRAKRIVEEMRVERIEAIEPLTDEQFDQFFGSAPDLTGDLATDKFVDRLRADDE